MRVKVLTFVGFAITIIGLFLYLSPYITSPTRTGDHYVYALQTLTLTMHFDRGERLEGYFTVRGGNDDVKFYIKNPYGAVILDAGTVTGRHDFAFTAEHEGVYTLYFDNTFSLITSKTIFLSYRVTVKSILYDLSLPIAVVGIAILALGLISIYEKKMKERKATTSTS